MSECCLEFALGTRSATQLRLLAPFGRSAREAQFRPYAVVGATILARGTDGVREELAGER